MPNSNDEQSSLDQLIADYVCGTCDDVSKARLAALVENDPQVAAVVGRQLALHRVLHVMQQSAHTADSVLACLENQHVSPAEIERLIAEFIADSVDCASSIADQARLLTICEANPQVAAEVSRHLQLKRILHESHGAAINANVVMSALPQPRDSSLQTRVLLKIAEREKARRWRTVIPLATAALLLFAVLLSVLLVTQKNQSQSTLPLTSASPTETSLTTPFATSFTKKEFPVIRAGHSAEWPNNIVPFDKDGQLITTHIDLCAGIAELEMPSGAIMVLQGPILLDITGDNSVRLMLGRLTTFVPERAVGFSLQAEGLEIIDLGTSFGISQGIDGVADVHVFSGAVEAITSIEGVDERMRLNADEAIRISPRGGSWERVPCAPERFVFSLRPQILALDLADIIAGGDGFGIGVADGIDPSSGNLMSAPAIGYGIADMTYHPVESLMTIDGVFIPNGKESDNQITSQGDRFRFPITEGRSYDLIRRGGTYDVPRFGGRPQKPGIPPIFGGIDYRAAGHSAIGMHANVGFTVDLQAVAYRHPDMHVAQFTTMLANVGLKGGSGKADFWIFIDGKLVHHEKEITAKQSPRSINIQCEVHNRYLTLVSTDSGNMVLDWITLGDPCILLGASNN